jgi:hypothetical protein
LTGNFGLSARTVIEGMRLERRLHCLLLPLDEVSQQSAGQKFERLLIENRYSHYRPETDFQSA